MIERSITPVLREAASRAPVVVLLGPRQSGKTTLCRAVFSDLPYVDLEPLDRRRFAEEDPRGFLESVRDGAVIDEVQRVPELLSYLQEEVDRDPRPGRFVLTGSENLTVSASVGQSLAGRAAMLTLLPPSYDELRGFADAPTDLFELLVRGSFPRPYDRHLDARAWIADYVTTYVERDVRALLAIGDLVAFRRFLGLVAGSTAREWNASRIASDAGITHPTASRWLSVLEASHLLMRLPPLVRNVRKRLVKAPKLHLLDSGLICHLLGIESAQQLEHHPLRGAVFESWVASEVQKALVHRGEAPRLSHYRDARGREVDLVVERGGRTRLVEVKSGATFVSDHARAMLDVRADLRAADEHAEVDARVVYGGRERIARSDLVALPWASVAGLVEEP